MDEIDQAQALAAQIVERTLENHQRNMPKGESATHCEDCDKAIPEERRQAYPGCRRCVGCQEQHEILSHWRG